MGNTVLTERITAWMRTLCVDIGSRPVGSSSNRQATDFFGQTLRSFGMTPETLAFDCLDWESGEVQLEVGGKTFPASVSPFSLPCDVQAELASASSLEELEAQTLTGKLVLLHGEIAKEQLMPKSFTFYNPEHHQRIIATLEKAKPAGIIAATGKNPELAGSVYPFPLFEDGDFDIPSVYMKDVDGEKLFGFCGQTARLRFESRRIPSVGQNVTARIPGISDNRIVVCAHIDTKPGTPGALDDGTGTIALLALAELLSAQVPQYTIELAALNGEDYYSAPGQMAFLAANQEIMQQVYLAINLDAPGYRDVSTAVSHYNAPEPVQTILHDLVQSNSRFVVGEPWYQGDHSIFIQNGRPAVAVTSENFHWLSSEITHTPKDSIDKVDFDMLADIAMLLSEFILRLGVD